MTELFAKKVIMPDIVGLQLRNANQLLNNQRFDSVTVHYVESYESENSVVRQEPPKGHLIDAKRPVTLFVSKTSLIQYLPSVYQANAGLSKENFVKEFLWIFTHIFEGVTEKIDRMETYFSPLDADPEFLPWLASWFGLTLDASWDVIKRRKVIHAAASIFRERGTVGCMTTLINLFTDLDVTIVENRWPYKGFIIGVYSAVGIDTIILPPMNLSHCFLVDVPMDPLEIPHDQLAKLHRVIQVEKPAHAAYFLRFQPPEQKDGPGPVMRIGVTDATAIGMKAMDID